MGRASAALRATRRRAPPQGLTRASGRPPGACRRGGGARSTTRPIRRIRRPCRRAGKTASPSAANPLAVRRSTSSKTPITPIDRGGQDRRPAGRVVEADVAAGHRKPERAAAVGEPAAGLGEGPHHFGFLGGAEVQAVGDGVRHGAGGGHVAVGLGERELRAGVRIQLRRSAPGRRARARCRGRRLLRAARRRRHRASRARCCRARSGRTAR